MKKSDSFLEYRIYFIEVDSVSDVLQNKNGFGRFNIGEDIYSIVIDDRSKRKDLAKLNIPYVVSLFRKYCRFKSKLNGESSSAYFFERYFKGN